MEAFHPYRKSFPGAPLVFSKKFTVETQELLESTALRERNDESTGCFVAQHVRSTLLCITALVANSQAVVFKWKSFWSKNATGTAEREKSILNDDEFSGKSSLTVKLPFSKRGYSRNTVVTFGNCMACCSSEGHVRIWDLSKDPRLDTELRLDNVLPVSITVDPTFENDSEQKQYKLLILTEEGDIVLLSSVKNSLSPLQRFARHKSSRLLVRLFETALNAVTVSGSNEEDQKDGQRTNKKVARIFTCSKLEAVVTVSRSLIEKWKVSEHNNFLVIQWSANITALVQRPLYHATESITILDAEMLDDKYVVLLVTIFWLQEPGSSVYNVQYNIGVVDVMQIHTPSTFNRFYPLSNGLLNRRGLKEIFNLFWTVSGKLSYTVFPGDGSVFVHSITPEMDETFEVKSLVSTDFLSRENHIVGVFDMLPLAELLPTSTGSILDSLTGVVTLRSLFCWNSGICAPLSTYNNLSIVVDSSVDRSILKQFHALWTAVGQYVNSQSTAAKIAMEWLDLSTVDDIVLLFLKLFLDMCGDSYSPLVKERILLKVLTYHKLLDFLMCPFLREEKAVLQSLSESTVEFLIECIDRVIIMESLFTLETSLSPEISLNTSFSDKDPDSIIYSTNILSQAVKTMGEELRLQEGWSFYDMPSYLEKLVETLKDLVLLSKQALDNCYLSSEYTTSELSSKADLYWCNLWQLSIVFANIFEAISTQRSSYKTNYSLLKPFVHAHMALHWLNSGDIQDALKILYNFLISMETQHEKYPNSKSLEKTTVLIAEFLIAMNYITTHRLSATTHHESHHEICLLVSKYWNRQVFEIPILYRHYETVLLLLFEDRDPSHEEKSRSMFQDLVEHALSQNESPWTDFVSFAFSWLEYHGHFRTLFEMSRLPCQEALLRYIENGKSPRLHLSWLFHLRQGDYSKAAFDLYSLICLSWERKQPGSLNNCHTLLSMAIICLKISSAKVEWENELYRLLYLIKAQKEIDTYSNRILDVTSLVCKCVDEAAIESERLFERCGIALEIIERSALTTHQCIELSDYVWRRCIEREMFQWSSIHSLESNEEMKDKKIVGLAFFKLCRKCEVSLYEWDEILQRIRNSTAEESEHWTRNSQFCSLLSRAVYLSVSSG